MKRDGQSDKIPKLMQNNYNTPTKAIKSMVEASLGSEESLTDNENAYTPSPSKHSTYKQQMVEKQQ